MLLSHHDRIRRDRPQSRFGVETMEARQFLTAYIDFEASKLSGGGGKAPSGDVALLSHSITPDGAAGSLDVSKEETLSRSNNADGPGTLDVSKAGTFANVIVGDVFGDVDIKVVKGSGSSEVVVTYDLKDLTVDKISESQDNGVESLEFKYNSVTVSSSSPSGSVEVPIGDEGTAADLLNKSDADAAI